MMGIESGAMAVISFVRSRAVVTDVWMWANPAMTGTRRLVMAATISAGARSAVTGAIGAGESCDDGNRVETDACTNVPERSMRRWYPQAGP